VQTVLASLGVTGGLAAALELFGVGQKLLRSNCDLSICINCDKILLFTVKTQLRDLNIQVRS